MSLRIALLGAESTGKSSLAASLAQSLREHSGLRVAAVPELLRDWCEREQRTPEQHEQLAIAQAQQAAIDAAAAAHEIVVCDTTALMTAVYSEQVFSDRQLHDWALDLQAGFSLNLLMGLDLPWVADGLQRDGPQVREPVDRLLRRLLQSRGLPFSVVRGQGQARLDAALNAVTPLLASARVGATPTGGLFSRLLQREADLPQASAWTCQLCDDADCEHLLRRSR